jgi:hypothetical protein
MVGTRSRAVRARTSRRPFCAPCWAVVHLHLYWTCQDGSRRSASLPRNMCIPPLCLWADNANGSKKAKCRSESGPRAITSSFCLHTSTDASLPREPKASADTRKRAYYPRTTRSLRPRQGRDQTGFLKSAHAYRARSPSGHKQPQ